MSRALRRSLALVSEHPRRFVAVGAALVVAVTVALVLATRGSEPAEVVPAPGTVVALDPRNNRLVDAFGVGGVPSQLATGGNVIWVYNSADGTVSRIEPSRRTVRTFSIGSAGSPRIGLALGHNSAWVAVRTVYRLDLRSTAVRTLRLPARAGAGLVAAGPSDIWLIGGKFPIKPPPPGRFPPPQILAWHVDPRTNEVTRAIRVDAGVLGSSPMAVVIGGDSLWIRGQLGVVRLDRRTGRLRGDLRLGEPVYENAPQWGGFIAGAGSLWVTDIGRSAVFRVNLKTGLTVATIPVQGRLAGVTVGAGAVWVADSNGVILKVDPRTNEIVSRIPVDGVPNGLAFGFGRLWIAFD